MQTGTINRREFLQLAATALFSAACTQSNLVTTPPSAQDTEITSNTTEVDPNDPYSIAEAVLENSYMTIEQGEALDAWGPILISVENDQICKIVDEQGNHTQLLPGLNFITADVYSENPLYKIDVEKGTVTMLTLGLFASCKKNQFAGISQVINTVAESQQPDTQCHLILRDEREGQNRAFIQRTNIFSKGITLKHLAGLATESLGFEFDKS